MNTSFASADEEEQRVCAAITAAPRPFEDLDAAAEAGRRSGEARRRRAALTPEERALESIGAKLGRLTEELINAALGQGDFEELKLETRVTALQRLIEWKLGRPAAAKPSKDDPEENPVPKDGDALFE